MRSAGSLSTVPLQINQVTTDLCCNTRISHHAVNPSPLRLSILLARCRPACGLDLQRGVGQSGINPAQSCCSQIGSSAAHGKSSRAGGSSESDYCKQPQGFLHLYELFVDTAAICFALCTLCGTLSFPICTLAAFCSALLWLILPHYFSFKKTNKQQNGLQRMSRRGFQCFASL